MSLNFLFREKGNKATGMTTLELLTSPYDSYGTAEELTGILIFEGHEARGGWDVVFDDDDNKLLTKMCLLCSLLSFFGLFCVGICLSFGCIHLETRQGGDHDKKQKEKNVTDGTHEHKRSSI